MKQLKHISLLIVLFGKISLSQTAIIFGKITCGEKPVELASIGLMETSFGITTDSAGNFILKNIPAGNYKLRVSSMGYDDFEKQVSIKEEKITLNISLTQNNQTLEEVVITGVSVATLIRENPISVVSISQKAIEQSNENNIVDVLVKNVPGLNAVKTGPNISKPFIRGLGYNRVLTLYDGLRQEGQQWGDEHGLEADAYNIEKAEVIKGPASLMFGSDALAGVVSLFPFVQNNDDKKVRGKFTSEYQDNNNLIGNGLRLNYGSKYFFFSLSGSYRISKNYRNAVDGRVYNSNFNEKNLSAIFGFKNEKGYSRIALTLYDNLQGIPDGSRDSLSRKFTKQTEEGNNDDIKNRPLVSDKELNSYQFSPLHQHIQHYRIYSRNFYQLKKSDVDFLFGAQQNIRREYTHPTLPNQAGMFVKLNTLNYGLRYNAPEIFNVNISTGINSMLQNNKSLNATDFPIPDYSLFDVGMYVYAKWKHHKWTASGGLRYDIREVQWHDFYVKRNPLTGFAEHSVFPDTFNSVLQFPAYKKMFYGMSASFGLTFQATKHISLKANIGRAYRAPNITEMASHGLDPGAHIIYLGNRNFNPEFSLQEDVGASARFKNFSADVSLFNNHIQNYIYLTMLVDANGNAITDAQGNKTYQYQQAAAQLHGVEAVFSIHPEKLRGFNFDNNLALVYGFNKNVIYRNKGVNGEYLPLIPPMKLLSNLSHKFQMKSKIISSLSPKIELEYSAAQNRYLGLNNTETSTAAYTLLNAGFSAEVNYFKKCKLQFSLQVNNVFDKAYQSHLNRLKYFEYYNQSPNARYGMYNMGRNICMKLILSF